MVTMRVSLAAVLLGGLACKSVQPVMTPAQFIPQTNPEVVVVTYTDNSQVVVSQPRVSGDSLFGTWLGLGEPVAVPLSQVQRMDAVQRDKTRTTFLIAGLTAMTAGGVWAFSQLTKSGGPSCDYSYTAGGQVPEGRCTGIMQPQ